MFWATVGHTSSNGNLLSNWSAAAIAVVAVGGALAAFFRWLAHAILRPLKDDIYEVRKELKPNGGESLADSIRRQEIVASGTASAIESLTLDHRRQDAVIAHVREDALAAAREARDAATKAAAEAAAARLTLETVVQIVAPKGN